MKLAELFAEIGFKVSGLDDLTKMDNQMKSIAANARDAVIALRQLARVQIPKQFIPQGQARVPRGTAAGAVPGLVPVTAQGSGANVVRSANIIVQNARMIVQQATTGGGGGIGGGPRVIPSAAGDGGGLGGIAKFGLGVLGFTTLLGALKNLVGNFKEMIQASRQAASATDKLTSSTGLSIRELKQWEFLASKANLEPGVVESTLQRLTANREAMRYGKGNFTPFSMFGIDWTADAGTQLRQFFQRTARDTQAQAEEKASMLGIDPSIVYARKFLDQGGNLPPGSELSGEQQKAVMELNGAWKELTFNMSSLASKLTADLAPALRDVIGVLNTIERFFVANDGARKAATAFPSILFPGLPSGIIGALLPKAQPAPAAVTHFSDITVNNHGIKDQQVLRQTGATVERAVSDALYSETPAYGDR